LRRQVVAAFEKHKTPLNMGMELPSLEAVKRFVAMGNGVALVPRLTVGRELASGELVQVPVEALRFERHLRLVHRKGANLSHAAIAFLKVVRSLSLERGAPYEFRVERGG
jgi:DNA-binding transcriptional LysR family regulator